MTKVKRDEEKKDVLQRMDDSLKALQQRFDELFGFSGDFRSRMRALWNGDSCCLEALGDVQESENEYIVTLDLPMVNREDIEITVMDDYIAIQAKMREELQYERWGTVQRQIRFRSLAKKVPLPKDADSDNIRAAFREGLLEIRIQKHEKKKRIQIEGD
ncbi:MAG: Hsp20/alpha crystallin family protein [Candidatus Thorarchaeota archaeon]